MKRDEQIKKVAEYWGKTMPTMAMEELAECIQAISKYERAIRDEENMKHYDDPHDTEQYKNLIKELADVYISIQAMRHTYGIDPYEITEAMDKKLSKKY